MLFKVFPDGEEVTWRHNDGTPYYINMTSPLTARAVRLHPLTFTGYPTIRLEFYGCALGIVHSFVCASGYNFAGSATRGGRRIAAIVLGRDSQTDRAVSAAKLLTDAFQKPGFYRVAVQSNFLTAAGNFPSTTPRTPRPGRPSPRPTRGHSGRPRDSPFPQRQPAVSAGTPYGIVP